MELGPGNWGDCGVSSAWANYSPFLRQLRDVPENPSQRKSQSNLLNSSVTSGLARMAVLILVKISGGKSLW